MKQPNYENKRLRINTPLRGHKIGAEILVKTDREGTPLDQYWRRRVKDSEIDNCVEFIQTPKKKKED